MVFEPSEILFPTKPEEAAHMLRSPDTRAVAGNTWIYYLGKTGRLANVRKLVDISKLGLDYMKQSSIKSDDGVVIGALATFDRIASSPLINKRSEFAGLIDAINSIPLQIRNMATIGGSICTKASNFDLPVVLIALGAELELLSPEGERKTISVESFVQTMDSPIDLLTEVHLGRSNLSRQTASSFSKLCRRFSGFAIVNASALVTLDDSDRRIHDLRLAIGAITQFPLRLTDVENALCDKEISPDLVTHICKEEADKLRAELVPSVHASVTYKKKVLPIVTRDAIISAIDRARRVEVGLKVEKRKFAE